MSSITIKPDAVRHENNGLSQNLSMLSNIRKGFSNLRHSIDEKIMDRRQIGVRLTSASNSLSILETRFRHIEQFVNNSVNRYCSADQSIVQNARSFGGSIASESSEGNDWVKMIYDAAMPMLGLIDKEVKILTTASGLKLKIFRKDGQILVKLIGEELSGPNSFKNVRQLLRNDLGGHWNKWKNNIINNMVNDGIAVYDEGARSIVNNSRFVNTQFSRLNEYINHLTDMSWAKAGNTFTEEFESFLNPLKGWGEATTLAKGVKVLGAVDTVWTIFNGAKDALYNQKTHKIEITHDGALNFCADTTMDLSTGATAIATGAAIGSFIAPPVGTVVGAVAGVTINTAINWEFGGPPPKSCVDYCKDGARASLYFLVDDVAGGAVHIAGNVANNLVNQTAGMLHSIIPW